MIKKYRKKPVEIDAALFEYNEDSFNELREWMGDSFGGVGKERHPDAIGWLHVKTLEDGYDQVEHIASEGDYIIQGVHGEFYPCKPDIFAKTYEVVGE